MFRHEIIVTKGLLPFKIIIHNYSAVQITRHWHRSVEIDFTVHGNADYFTSGRKTHLSDGEFIIINSGEVHGVENIGPGDERRSLTLLIPYKTLVNLVPNINHFYFVSKINQPEEMNQVSTELSSIYSLWNDKSTQFNTIEVLGHFYLLMSLLLKDFMLPKNKNLTFNDIKKQGKVKRVINYLSQNYQESLTLEQVADHFGLSHAYLDRLFKKEVQTGLMRYLQLIRLQHAYESIANTDLPISVIADQSGFANVRSLQKLFKQVYDLTPTEYRKKIKGQ